MTVEWGIFNDEGCVERGFYLLAHATFALRTQYANDGCAVLEMCGEPGHEGARIACHDCDGEDE